MASAAPVTYLKSLSLEDLLNLEVTTVSRRPERVGDVASAITVITADDIRRSGATSLADLMRLPTGLQVARSDGRTWAIASRGFNLTSSNKLLVLMDGRSLYTPLFGGVLWDAQDTLLADLDRIEVVRGPGATMWGANAVNGVINIQSKSARDTQGGLLVVSAGDEERQCVAVREGVQVARDVYARVYAKEFQRDDLVSPNGQDTGDDWKMWQTGFRIDALPSGRPDTFTFQGDLYHAFLGTTNSVDSRIAGGNLLGRWARNLSSDRAMRSQLYYDRVERFVPGQFRESRDTVDLDVQFNTTVGLRDSFVAGLNARSSRDETGMDGTVQFDPSNRRISIFSGFVQEEKYFFGDLLGITGGIKFEHHSSTGFEFQPSIRAAWRFSDRQTLWASVARAVRTPSRFDDDLRVYGAPGVLFVRGDPSFRSEKLTSLEAGYRLNRGSHWSLDANLFYNFYDQLRSEEPGSPFPFTLRNKLNAETWGGDLALRLQATARCQLRALYSRLHKHLSLDAGSADPTGGSPEGNDPRDMFTVTSAFDLSSHWELDSSVRYVSSLPNPAVPSYTALDLRAAWHRGAAWELALVGQNVLDPQHREFGAQGPAAREVQRSYYGKVTWNF
jgi:iron complex outermembrane receptor protein